MTPAEKERLQKLYDRYVELKPLAEEFKNVVSELRPLLCPFKVGDIVRWKQESRNLRGTIKQVGIDFSDRDDPARYRLFAKALLPNGKEGQVLWEIWSGCEKEEKL